MANYTTGELTGGYSSLNYPGNKITAGSLGATTDPRTANVLQEVSSKLSSGIKNIEVTAVQSGYFDSVPKDHLKEVNRLAKLTGVGMSVHGPVIDTTGIREGRYNEVNREDSEKQIINVLERSHDLDPKGNIPVTFHSAEGIAGSQFMTEKEIKSLSPDEKAQLMAYGVTRPAKRLIVVNRETGQSAALEKETQYSPESRNVAKGSTLIPEHRMRSFNSTEWDNSITQLVFNKERADELLEQNRGFIEHIEPLIGKEISMESLAKIPEQRQAYEHWRNARVYLEDLHKEISNKFHKAYKYGDEKQKRELIILSDNFKKSLEKGGGTFGYSRAMQDLLHNLKEDKFAPKMYIPLEEFALEQSSKTYGNAAFEANKKFSKKGGTTPIISIENPPAGFALSTGEDLKNLVQKSRAQFVERAVKEGMSQSEATNQAKKLIGATWDLGHINMLRKQGFTEKEIIKETEKIAPYVKHVHLSDNFGFEHTELPMGMGNVPMKEMMERLGEKGFEAKKIIEATQWYQHFGKGVPFQETLEHLGSPLYSAHAPIEGGGGYWNQAPEYHGGSYFSGYGQMLTQGNYETFGSGFSMLPQELGGQRPGAGGSRMSGRPME